MLWIWTSFILLLFDHFLEKLRDDVVGVREHGRNFWIGLGGKCVLFGEGGGLIGV